jgi:hypothetical protein
VSLGTGHPNQEPQSLHDTMIWNPEIPNHGVCLNEEYFKSVPIEKDTSTQPYCALFGGPGGEYLSYLTGISFNNDRDGLLGMKFQYLNEQIKDGTPLQTCFAGWRHPYYNNWSEIHDIDGPGGERIICVQIQFRQDPASLKKEWIIASFKVGDGRYNNVIADDLQLITNKHRNISYPSNDPLSGKRKTILPKLPTERIDLALGTTMIGIWFKMVRKILGSSNEG